MSEERYVAYVGSYTHGKAKGITICDVDVENGTFIPRKEIENKLSMQSFIVNKTLGQLKNFSKKDIERALAKSVMIEEDIKMGRITDLIGVEIMLVEFSS